jgi:hypothetical protein
MTQTNLILKIIRYTNIDPLISIELYMDNYSEALDIADKKVYDDDIPF